MGAATRAGGMLGPGNRGAGASPETQAEGAVKGEWPCHSLPCFCNCLYASLLFAPNPQEAQQTLTEEGKSHLPTPPISASLSY
jgi:hypothetical protein